MTFGAATIVTDWVPVVLLKQYFLPTPRAEEWRK